MVSIVQLKNEKGQVLVEFALCAFALFLFIYGLITCFLWGTAGVLAQEISDEVARKYAVTMDQNQAQKLGQTYFGRWAYVFIDPAKTKIAVSNSEDKADATTRVVPRITRLFMFSMPEIDRSSTCVLEEEWRERSQYE